MARTVFHSDTLHTYDAVQQHINKAAPQRGVAQGRHAQSPPVPAVFGSLAAVGPTVAVLRVLPLPVRLLFNERIVQ